MENNVEIVEEKKKPRQYDELGILEKRPLKRVSRIHLEKKQRSERRSLLIRQMVLWSLPMTIAQAVSSASIEVFIQNLLS